MTEDRIITAGRWRVRLTGSENADAALALRARVFRGGACDRDAFDARARHLVVEDGARTLACARLQLQRRAEVGAGYSAQYYDLQKFSAAFPRALEVGRICLAPEVTSPDVLRLLLATLAQLVLEARAAVLFGCASFPLAEASLDGLTDRLAPAEWAPGRKASEVRALTGTGPLPPLLRSYLALGARVSDHGVVDRDLGTVHVFTALPIAAIPPNRARLLTGMLDAV